MVMTFKEQGQIEKIDRNDVHLLWYADFWDGPINGLCLYHNKKYWFAMLADADEDMPDTSRRKFLVLELSPQQLAEEERWHELFRQKVGTHCDFEEAHPKVKPKETQREFYEEYEKRSKPDYSNNSLIGWFVMS